MSPRLSDGAGDSLISRDRRDRDGSSARLGGQGAFCPWVCRPLALLLQGWAAEPHAAPGVGTSPGSWRGTVPAVLSGIAALHRLWQWSGREARAGKGQEKFPAAGEVPSCRGISQLQGNIPPEQPRPAPPAQGCPDLLGTCSLGSRCLLSAIWEGKTSPKIHLNLHGLLFPNPELAGVHRGCCKSFLQPFQDPSQHQSPSCTQVLCLG